MASVSRIPLLLICCCLLWVAMVEGKRGRRAAVTVQALEAMVQHQARTIAGLEAKLTALHNDVSAQNNVLGELRDKMANASVAVAFSASFSRDDPINGFPLGWHKTLKFDNVITNIGDGYNSTNGIFTAPTTGVYAFALQLMVPNARGALDLAIVKGDLILDQAWAPATAGDDDQGSTEVTAYLTAGEQVWVRQHSGVAVRGSFWTIFTGYLVQAM